MNKEEEQQEEISKPTLSKKKILWGMLFILIAVSILGLLWYFRGPAEGTVRVIESTSKETKSERLPPKRFQGKHISFSYPAEYEERDVQPDVVSAEKGLFVASGNTSKTIAFSVQEMRGKTLSDIPSYQLRSMVQKDEYHRSERKTDAYNAVVFVKSEEGYEKTTFVLRGGILLTLSVSSQALADPQVIEADFEMLLSDVRFEE